MTPTRFTRRLAALGANREGSIPVIVIASLAALIGSAALSVDVGTLFFAKRKQQAATDIAAILAASHLTTASQAAQAALGTNGAGPTPQFALEYGAYVPNGNLSPDQRFQTTDPSTASAVRVSVTGKAPLYFGSTLAALGAFAPTLRNGITITTRATASQADFASFSIGSRLASLNGGLLNSLLGALLGTNLSLSVMDYNALASAQIDVFQFSKALATRVGVSAVTYGQLASASYRTSDILSAMAATLQAGAGGGSAAVSQLAQAKAGSTDSVSLQSLFGFGPFSTAQIGADAPAPWRLSALDMVTALAQIGGRGQLISLDLSGVAPGLASLQLQLAIGERPAGASFSTLGRTGAQAQTAQTRLLLKAQLKVVPPLLAMQLPIYLDLASAKATLSSLACSPDPASPSATLSVQSSVADAWIGTFSGDMRDFSSSLQVSPAPIASVLGIATIYGRAHTSFASTTTPVAFTSADIANETKRTSSVTDPTASLASGLAANLQLSMGPLGNFTPPAAASALVTQSLSAVAPVLDPILDGLLAALGVRVGEADTWFTGVRCGGGVLVN